MILQTNAHDIARSGSVTAGLPLALSLYSRNLVKHSVNFSQIGPGAPSKPLGSADTRPDHQEAPAEVLRRLTLH